MKDVYSVPSTVIFVKLAALVPSVSMEIWAEATPELIPSNVAQVRRVEVFLFMVGFVRMISKRSLLEMQLQGLRGGWG